MKKNTPMNIPGWMVSTAVAFSFFVVCVLMVSPARAAENSSKPVAPEGELKEFFEVGLKFHGHRCPAMPMGIRAGMAGMKALGVRTVQG